MQTKYSYWVFRNQLSEKDINKIKRIAKKSGYADASTKSFYSSDLKKDAKIRDGGVAFSDDPFLYDIFNPLVNSANEQGGWKYDLDWFEDVQIAEYRKNQHYSWHRDGASDHFASYADNGNYKGKVRKLSLVACLSNGYVGGALEFAVQSEYEENEILRPEMGIGDVIIFPSHIFHRSTPIEKGIKYSASMWCLGPPFK